MRKTRTTAALALMTCLLFAGVADADGIYGTILYGNDGVVDSPTIIVQKLDGSTWTQVGTTSASACGYYAFYITSGSGNYRICVYGAYDLRYGNVNSCSTKFQTGEQIGACTSSFSYNPLFDAWKRMNMCATGGSSCQ